MRSASDKFKDVSELDLPYVVGLSVNFKWKDIEPEPGHYNWALLDKAHELTVTKNKLLMIRITAGMQSPAWIYEQGAKKITFYGDETNWLKPDTVTVMPVPWDDVYLQAWKRFIIALGNKISNWSNVYCIQMTGGGIISEMHLPKKRKSTIKEWRAAGISDEKIVAMWEELIDTYNKAMPLEAGLGLNLGLPFKKSHAAELVYEYALKKYPGRVWFQQDGLQEKYPPNSLYSRMLRQASTKTVVGYQMLGGGKFLDAQTGNRRLAFERAIADGCSYVEVYRADLKDAKWKEAMVFLARGLADNQSATY